MSEEDMESMADDQAFMHENGILKELIDLSDIQYRTALE
jgi:hypothetical protein